MFLWLIQNGILVEVHLEFMVPGHSMMPCDRCFGVLEKAFKNHEQIHTPEEYRDIIHRSNKSTSITMSHKYLLNFKDLLQYIQFRKAKTVKFSKSRRIILSHLHPWSMLLVTPTGSERVDLNKSTNNDNMLSLSDFVGSFELPRKYIENQHIKITASKLIHLQKLRPYLSCAGYEWVDSVTNGQ